MENQSYSKAIKKLAEEEESNDTDMEAQSPAREDSMKNFVDVTSVHHSERTTGKEIQV